MNMQVRPILAMMRKRNTHSALYFTADTTLVIFHKMLEDPAIGKKRYRT